MASQQRLNTTITIGGAVTAGLRSAIGSTVAGLRQIGTAIRDVQRQQTQVGQAIAANRATGQSVAALQQQYDRLGQSIDRMRLAQQRLAANRNAVTANNDARAGYRSKIGETIGLGIGAAAPIVMAAKFEKAMLGVAKQVDGARDDGGKLTATYFEMAKAIQQMGREIPIATNDLAEMVSAGARMGVGKDMKPAEAQKELIEFTKTSAMMASAFDLPAAQLADNMGKIKTLFGLKTQEELRGLADSINYLDDNAISKGGDIIDFMQRVGGVATSVKISGKEMAALGSTLLTLGERTETAGTATNAIFSKFAAAEKGTKKFRSAMKEIGLSTAKVQKGMQVDAQGTLLTVLEKIAKLPKDKQLGVMAELVGLEHSDTLAKLVGGITEYRKQIDLASSKKAEGSMGREFAAQLATTSAQFAIMKNRAVELGVNIGAVLLPAVNDVMGALSPVVTKMAEWSREHPRVTKAVVGTVVALTSLKVAGWAAGYAWTFLKGGVLATQGAFLRVAATMSTIGNLGGSVMGVVRGLALAFALAGPPLWVVGAAAAAVAAAGVLVWKYWEPLKAFFAGFGQGLVEGMAPISQAITDAFAPVVSIIKPIVQPALDAIGTWIKAAIGWFGELFTPINAASETTTKFGEAGKVCGEVVAGAFRIMLAPIEAVLNSIKWINDNIGGVIQKASQLGGTLQSGWQAAKDFVSGGPAPAAVPALRGAAGGAGAGAQTNTINIHQTPGQDSRQLADEVIRRMKEREGVNRRSGLADRAN
jgi:TP901 family phage tail tape measure protein